MEFLLCGDLWDQLAFAPVSAFYFMFHISKLRLRIKNGDGSLGLTLQQNGLKFWICHWASNWAIGAHFNLPKPLPVLL